MLCQKWTVVVKGSMCRLFRNNNISSFEAAHFIINPSFEAAHFVIQIKEKYEFGRGLNYLSFASIHESLSQRWCDITATLAQCTTNVGPPVSHQHTRRVRARW